jgi:DNA primase
VPVEPSPPERLNGGDPARLAAVQNEMWVLQQYDQALRERGAEAL